MTIDAGMSPPHRYHRDTERVNHEHPNEHREAPSAISASQLRRWWHRRPFEALDVRSAGVLWIIDLREPGGASCRAISLFVPEGVIVATATAPAGSRGPRDRPCAHHHPPSAAVYAAVARVFAAALQEYGVAYVVGANTNGRRLHRRAGLGDGSSLAVTTNVIRAGQRPELASISVAPTGSSDARPRRRGCSIHSSMRRSRTCTPSSTRPRSRNGLRQQYAS
jgi:hypothetical protein